MLCIVAYDLSQMQWASDSAVWVKSYLSFRAYLKSCHLRTPSLLYMRSLQYLASAREHAYHLRFSMEYSNSCSQFNMYLYKGITHTYFQQQEFFTQHDKHIGIVKLSVITLL